MYNNALFFHPSSELYGADKILVYIIKNFPASKKTLILKEEGPLVTLLKSECSDVNIYFLSTLPIIAKKNFNGIGIFKFLLSFLSFRKKIKKIFPNKPDIVYLNTLATAPILFHYAKAKKIIHIHEILKNKDFTSRIINKFTLKKTDAIIGVSDAVCQNLIEISNSQSSKKIHLVYNGIKLSDNSINENSNLRIDNDNILKFALIGRIKPSHKGQNLLLDAISKITPVYLSQCHFYFVGSTVSGQEYMLDNLKKKIEKLNLNAVVSIISFVEQIEEIYQNVDIIIVPSTIDDSFPTTVLEGMYWSKPIIGTKIGGIPEMIKDKETGFLTNRDDPDDLAKKIIYYIDNKNEISKMGEKGKDRFESMFTEKQFIENFQNTIEKIEKQIK
jgi:Glycosyltransferase